ncbi:MAG TPA: hypothetical protein PLU22_25740 [Polyangiaceae bacterium]|nr:hypothetical protein [Polyangiaceae bacterium]
MPTSKLWLEHTEKAAWDSVQALREKIASAERRIERLGPPIDAWQPLLDELDGARAELGLPSASYVEVLRLLLERAARDRTRLAELERAQVAHPSEPPFDVTALMRGRRDARLDDEDLAARPQLAALERDLERRRGELMADRALPREVDALLARIDAQVADLAEVEGGALTEAALDLAVFALELAARGRDGE